MTRAEREKRREQIRCKYVDGMPAKNIAELYELTEAYVYSVCKGLTNYNCKGYATILRENAPRVINLRKGGATTKEIAALFGVSNDAVRTFLYTRGVKNNESHNSEDTVAKRVKEKTNGLLEYVSGYTTKDKPIIVRCALCGGEFERTYHNITTRDGVTCPCCTESERKRKADEKKTEMVLKRQAKELRIKERQAEEERKKVERIHKCPVCGTETNRPKYCCPDCAKKSSNKQRDHRRRMKIKARLIDNDITVEGLYRRDSGVCYLCGGRCNLEDYTVRDGAFVAGDWYPSIDHVVPLAKGGEHSWNNVRLAHRRCNTLKSDKII